MRVLLIILQFPPDVNSNGLLMAQIGAGLVERGHMVSVITSFPHYAQFRVWDQYRGKLFEKSSFRGMQVLRLFIYANGRKQNMLHRFLSYFSFSALALLAGLASHERYDVILCPNGGFLTGIAAALIGRARSVPLVLNLQDLYPETPIQTQQIRQRTVIRLLRALESYMYRTATHISVITPSFRQYLLKRGVAQNRITVVPNFVDVDFIRPLPRDNEFSRAHGLADRFVVSHSGNVGLAYDLNTLLDAAAALRARTDLVFLIVGDGVLKGHLQQRVAAEGLSNVRFLPYQPLDMLPFIRAASDVQLALNRPKASAHSLPSKVYEIMASGRPLLASADRDSDLWRLIVETGCGLVVEPGDCAALVNAISRLYTDSTLRRRISDRGRLLAMERYSRTAIVAQYEEILRRCAGSSVHRRSQPAALWARR